MKQHPEIFICAGEASGDLHASALIRAIRAQNPDVILHGVAGPQMVKEGCLALHRMEELNVMGLGDVIRALPRITRIEKSLLASLQTNTPDIAILVDFPGFNMRLGKKLRAMGIPVLHYIAPKLWAWGSWRVKKLKQSQDRLASILPFEETWFGERGIDVTYVGNPSAIECRSGWNRDELFQKLGIDKDKKLIALLPGSRPGELARHVPLMAELNREIKKRYPDSVTVTSRAPGVSDDQLRLLLDSGVTLIDRQQEGYALRADAAIAASGTATLELALWDVPTVLFYRASPFAMWLGKKLLRTRCVGLANIILGDEPVMPELLQEEASVENVLKELIPILEGDASVKQRQKFAELKEVLSDKNPSEELAKIVLKQLS
jgi:lipid-A-disaccharide synthase